MYLGPKQASAPDQQYFYLSELNVTSGHKSVVYKHKFTWFNVCFCWLSVKGQFTLKWNYSGLSFRWTVPLPGMDNLVLISRHFANSEVWVGQLWRWWLRWRDCLLVYYVTVHKSLLNVAISSNLLPRAFYEQLHDYFLFNFKNSHTAFIHYIVKTSTWWIKLIFTCQTFNVRSKKMQLYLLLLHCWNCLLGISSYFSVNVYTYIAETFLFAKRSLLHTNYFFSLM